MSLVLLRVDDRLIHGQVIEGWVRSLAVNHLMIASDVIVGDEVQKALFSLAVPDGIRVSCLSIKDAAAYLSGKVKESDRVLALVESPADALALVENGVPVNSINVGGVHFRPGKAQLLKSLSVDARDIDALSALLRRGVHLEGRALPMDDPENIEAVITDFLEEKR